MPLLAIVQRGRDRSAVHVCLGKITFLEPDLRMQAWRQYLQYLAHALLSSVTVGSRRTHVEIDTEEEKKGILQLLLGGIAGSEGESLPPSFAYG